MIGEQDYYTLLGVPRSADTEEIHKAYRRLARSYHPDVNRSGDDGEMFKKINEAHATLSDPESRRLFDIYGSRWRDAQTAQGQSSQESRTWDGFYDVFSEAKYGDNEGRSYNNTSFDDILSSLFGKAGNDNYTRYSDTSSEQIGINRKAGISITLEELYHGTTKIISWHKEIDGRKAGSEVEIETVQVRIPKGLKEGSIIRLAGKGDVDRYGKKGDLLLTINLATDNRFGVDGYDISSVVSIAPWESALGAGVTVKTLDGEIKLSIPPGCQSGRKFRVKGRGLAKKNGGSGDFYVLIEIALPDSLTEKEKRVYEQLKKVSKDNTRATRQQKAA